MTESTAVGTRGFNTEKLRNFCSLGLLAPNMEAKVVDSSTGTFLPPGGVGELWLRGPAIMKGKLKETINPLCDLKHCSAQHFWQKKKKKSLNIVYIILLCFLVVLFG